MQVGKQEQLTNLQLLKYNLMYKIKSKIEHAGTTPLIFKPGSSSCIKGGQNLAIIIVCDYNWYISVKVKLPLRF